MTSTIIPPGIRTITLYNGCSIAYTDEGSGTEILLFIHGLGAYGGTWRKNTESLRAKYRCISLDLPGNGYSGTGDYPYTMDFFAHCIIDFIGRLDLRHVTLVGHSMGGQIAITAALILPACCERLILCAPAGFETFALHERMMFRASMSYMSWLSSDEHAIQQLIRHSFYQMPADAARLEKELSAIARRQPARHYKMMTDRCMAAMLAEPVASRLGRISQPVLVLFGEKDALIPNSLMHPGTTRETAESGTRKIKRATLHMFRSCGHFLQWECAAKVNAQITGWMNKIHP